MGHCRTKGEKEKKGMWWHKSRCQSVGSKRIELMGRETELRLDLF